MSATKLNIPEGMPSVKAGGLGINAIALGVLTMSSTMNMVNMGFAVKSDYIKTSAVIIQELIKLIVSIAMLWLGNNRDIRSAILQIRENCFDHTLMIMAVPAVLYAIGNIMTIYIVYYIGPAMFQVFSQLKIVTTAIFCRIMLQKILSGNQTLAVLVLLTGVITVKMSQARYTVKASATIDEDKEAGLGGAFIGVALAITQAFMSGFCGAYLEKQFKDVKMGSGSNIWTKNVQLSAIGCLIAIITTFLTGDASSIYAKGFFHGYNIFVWGSVLLCALGGIMNALIMKYADNIVKGFAVAISMILTVFLSAFLFDFELDLPTLYGSLLVIAATFIYSGQIMVIPQDILEGKMWMIIVTSVSVLCCGSIALYSVTGP